jgi:hypothetical protein
MIFAMQTDNYLLKYCIRNYVCNPGITNVEIGIFQAHLLHGKSAHNQTTFYKNKLKSNNKNRAAELKVDAMVTNYVFRSEQFVTLCFNIL